MFNISEQFVKIFNRPKTYLLLGNILLVFFLILLSNLKVLPLELGDFLFFAFLMLALALYRPGWCFLLFIGMLPLENVNLAPLDLGLTIRPYQFIGAIIVLALTIRLLTKRLSFKLLKPSWYDWLVLVFVASGFLSALSLVFGRPTSIVDVGRPLELSLIIGTFAALYYLARNYIQNTEDLKRVVPFFLSSSIIVVFYGIWQNWAFLHNLANFETMPGRPNATFTEPDWLGLFLVLLMSVIYVLIYYQHVIASEAKQSRNNMDNLNITGLPRRYAPRNDIFLYIFLVLTFVLLIITVSRSAWVGAFIVYVIFVLIFFSDLRLRGWKWRETSWLKLKIVSCLIVAIAVVYVFHLTNFQLFNRVQSTGTGLQQITISCVPCANGMFGSDECRWKALSIQERLVIDENNRLEDYNCRHINLEEKEAEVSKGNFIWTAYRQDPNVNIRGEIYRKSWVEIRNHPVLGIGWGNISNILGKDGRGTPLNSSNIFLETYLGAGIMGFLAIVILLGYILIKSIKNYYYAEDNLQKTINLFIIISWFAMIIPNMFNAGIFLGIFWVWLAITSMKK
jgi:hypothetical protein